MLQDMIIKAKLDLTPPALNVIVGFNQDWFINTIEQFGGAEGLEESKVFALLFDTTPLEGIALMSNYKHVIDKYPNSDRIADKAIYIGNYKTEDFEAIISTLLKNFSLAGQEINIVAREDEYTKWGANADTD